MIITKSCPKCGGDILVDKRDDDEVCLQCGYREVEKIPPDLMDKLIKRGNLCKRCGHEWGSKQEKPTICPKCKSPYWDKARKNGKTTTD